jgi:DNA repair exonuclease SbcCD ATPase subunit
LAAEAILAAAEAERTALESVQDGDEAQTSSLEASVDALNVAASPAPAPPRAPAAAPAPAPPRIPAPEPAAAAPLGAKCNRSSATLWQEEEEAKQAIASGELTAARVAEQERRRAEEDQAATERQERWHAEEAERHARELADRDAQHRAKEEEVAELAKSHQLALRRREDELKAEQERLEAESARQKAIRESRDRVSASVNSSKTDDFAYNHAEGMDQRLKKFRQRGTGGDTLFIRIHHDANELQIEEDCPGLSLEDLVENLEDYAAQAAPRYVLHIHKKTHPDGRVQYPIAFLLFMPNSTPASLKMLYTRPVAALCKTFVVNKHFALTEPDELDADWLDGKFGFR